jgi:hypothetical protein
MNIATNFVQNCNQSHSFKIISNVEIGDHQLGFGILHPLLISFLPFSKH